MRNLTPYENKQVELIKIWKNEEPGVISKTFGIVVEPMAWLVQKIVPDAAIKGALDLTNACAEWLTDTKDIIRDGNVKEICELKNKNLELSDKLADEVHNWAIGVAVAEGSATGTGGIFTAPIDIPAIITIALRTIHKIGLCYGFECKTKEDKDFVLAIMSAASSNTMEEKVAALTLLKSIEAILIKQTWKSMSEKAIENQLGKEAAIIAIRNLAKQLGINLTKRRALASIPFIGAFVGGSVNGWYIKEIGWSARYVFQEKWLKENGEIVNI